MAERFSTGFVDALNTVGCVKDIMANFIIRGFDGTQPVDSDTTEGTANLLIEWTLDAGAFTSGVATNGLNFDVSTGGVLAKASGEIIRGIGKAAAGAGGTKCTWYRAYANTVVTGNSTTAIRFDGSVGTSSTNELQMTNDTIVYNASSTINDFNLTLRKS